MDRDELSAAIIADVGAVVMGEVARVLPHLLESDLGQIERLLQGVSRRVWGHLVTVLGEARGAAMEECPPCGQCGRPLRLIAAGRQRHLQGLVGDYTLERPYYHCAACHQGEAPLDTVWGLARGSLSPELLRVVCRGGLSDPFGEAAAAVNEALGVAVSADTVERMSERLGLVAEAATQGAMARVQQGQAPWCTAEVEAPPTGGVLAVAVDGVQVHRDDGWHEMKVVTVAPLGPALHHDIERGRLHLAWGTATYGAGFEEAETFWYRVVAEAARRGLGTPAVQTVVVLGDGADWIWRRARAFLGAQAEVVEIVDIFHAYGYLWNAGHALYGTGTPAALRWVERLKDDLYAHGAAPILAALETSAPSTAEATEAVRVAHGYFTAQAARMDYPRFVAAAFPVGSGAVESTCKSLVEARAKQAGMRWSRTGAQAIVSLRAVYRSGRWAAFWQSRPHRTHLHLCPRQPRRLAVPPTAPPSPASAPPRPQPVSSSPPRLRAAPTLAQRPLVLPRSA